MHYAPLSRSDSGNSLLLTIVGAGIGLSLLSANPGLTLASVTLAYVLVKLLWRPGEPPALLYAMGFQWLQASILIYFADLQNLSLKDLGAEHLEAMGDMVGAATWLTLIGILAVALGVRVAVGPKRVPAPSLRPASAPPQVDIQRLFYASLWAFALSSVLTKLGFMVTGLAEPVRGFVLLRWAIYYLFAYTVFSQQRGYKQLAIVFTIELAIGFLGFFSDFRPVLIVTLMAIMAAPNAWRRIRLRSVVAVVLLTLSLGTIWQSIKNDYRSFMNQGTVGQVILVSPGEQLAELATLVADLTPEKLLQGARSLVYRIQFVDFFGATMGMVPRYIPYENGKLWFEAIEHVLTPRLLNPNKPVINDSDRTAEYSGRDVARGQQGTSISIGYFAETYIDFGPFLMFLPLFVWGLCVGWTYRILTRSPRYPPFAYGCAVALITLNASLVEQSNIKMLGSMVMGFLALYLVKRFFTDKLLRLLLRPA